jgi:lipopolysaccharide transport system ATP-binding protein
MGNVAIRIQSLGKQYRKGERVYRQESLKEALLRKVERWSGRSGNTAGASQTGFFWALHDISLDVAKGQVLGLIGANGSGKSTLLKILARITRPTRGRIEIFGQVGSLLEVGTGFHPELTGRENVYLNGTILGMKKKEIDTKFDAIVQFSGVEDFLDTPVKRYSSGMQVRLAFSVAAYLEPEILLLDEVLSVGDASFQRKSREQMESVAKDGRTVVLVSHDLDSVKSLCARTVLLDHGEMVFVGPTAEALQRYVKMNPPDKGPDEPKLAGISISGLRTCVSGGESSHLQWGTPFTAEMELNTNVSLTEVRLSLFIEDSSGRIIIHHRTDVSGAEPVFNPGSFQLQAELPELLLGSGTYRLWTRLDSTCNGRSQSVDSGKVLLQVDGRDGNLGLLEIPCRWSFRKTDE